MAGHEEEIFQEILKRRFAMPHLDLEDRQIFYAERQDTATPRYTVILIHGAGGSHSSWLEVLPSLGAEDRVIAVDLPGHGSSEGLPSNSMAVYRDFIRDFARALDINTFVLGGHSMGGGITLDYALNYPDHLEGILLVGTGGRLKVLPEVVEAARLGIKQEGMAAWSLSPQAPPELVTRLEEEMSKVPPSVHYADFQACTGFDVMHLLPGIDIPTLILVGKDDNLTPVKYSQFMQTSMPRANLEVFEGAGHMLALEKPEGFITAVKRFLEYI
ncbi:MAG: alpha/beta fold hydrolase [Bacillota bacterium]